MATRTHSHTRGNSKLVAAAGSTVSGQTTNVNAKGVQLDGGQWFNVSNYAKGVVMPQRGQAVTLSLDAQGFIRGIIGGATQSQLPPVNGFSNNTNGFSAPVNRDRSIVLQTVMKVSGDILSGAPLTGTEFAETADTVLDWYESRLTVSSDNQNGVAVSENLEDLPF